MPEIEIGPDGTVWTRIGPNLWEAGGQYFDDEGNPVDPPPGVGGGGNVQYLPNGQALPPGWTTDGTRVYTDTGGWYDIGPDGGIDWTSGFSGEQPPGMGGQTLNTPSGTPNPGFGMPGTMGGQVGDINAMHQAAYITFLTRQLEEVSIPTAQAQIIATQAATQLARDRYNLDLRTLEEVTIPELLHRMGLEDRIQDWKEKTSQRDYEDQRQRWQAELSGFMPDGTPTLSRQVQLGNLALQRAQIQAELQTNPTEWLKALSFDENAPKMFSDPLSGVPDFGSQAGFTPQPPQTRPPDPGRIRPPIGERPVMPQPPTQGGTMIDGGGLYDFIMNQYRASGIQGRPDVNTWASWARAYGLSPQQAQQVANAWYQHAQSGGGTQRDDFVNFINSMNQLQPIGREVPFARPVQDPGITQIVGPYRPAPGTTLLKQRPADSQFITDDPSSAQALTYFDQQSKPQAGGNRQTPFQEALATSMSWEAFHQPAVQALMTGRSSGPGYVYSTDRTVPQGYVQENKSLAPVQRANHLSYWQFQNAGDTIKDLYKGLVKGQVGDARVRDYFQEFERGLPTPGSAKPMTRYRGSL